MADYYECFEFSGDTEYSGDYHLEDPPLAGAPPGLSPEAFICLMFLCVILLLLVLFLICLSIWRAPKERSTRCIFHPYRRRGARVSDDIMFERLDI